MPVETATYIHDLNPANPLISDTVYSTQAHLVLLKQVLQAQFPALGEAAVSVTAAAINTAVAAIVANSITVPQTGTTGASINFPAGSTGTTVTLGARPPSSGNGLQVISQGPTVAGVTPAPVQELSSNGAGGIAAREYFSAPQLAATTSITRAGYELLPVGMIMMWSGSVATIPAGFALCNGANGTPDLFDRFVIAAGQTYAPGTFGGNPPTIALSTANIPAHTHTLSDPGHVHGLGDPGHTHYLNDPGHVHGINDPGHAHTYLQNSQNQNGAGSYSNVSGAPNQGTATTTSGTGISVALHATGVYNSGSYTGMVMYGAATGITMGSVGSGAAFGIQPYYYALCFVMKIA